jgi:hypothetical protein
MKKIYFFLLSFLVFFQFDIVRAQERYSILSTGFGYLFSDRVNGNLSESFPYHSKDVNTGNTTNQIFQGSLRNPFAGHIFLIDLLNLEVVRNKHSIEGGVGMNTEMNNNYAVFFRGGYNFIFPTRFFLFRAGMDLVYLWGYDEPLGAIDNDNKIIDLLGHEAGTQFTTPASRYSPASTHAADQLDIFYRRTHLMLYPKISLTTKRSAPFHVAVEGGWFCPILQRDTILADQISADNRATNVVARVGINDDGASATFNNAKMNKSLLVEGLFVGIRVGYFVKEKAKVSNRIAS